jgi:hypothetical protein
MEKHKNPNDLIKGHEKMPLIIDTKINPEAGKHKVIVDQTPKGPPPAPKK